MKTIDKIANRFGYVRFEQLSGAKAECEKYRRQAIESDLAFRLEVERNKGKENKYGQLRGHLREMRMTCGNIAVWLKELSDLNPNQLTHAHLQAIAVMTDDLRGFAGGINNDDGI